MRPVIPIGFWLLLVALGPAASAADPSSEKTVLFSRGERDWLIYRIPGVVATRKGTLLAYCEARKTERGDWGAADLLLRRSTDGGRTWSEPAVIGSVAGPFHKNPAALAQKLGPPDAVTYNNPVAIADRKTGAVHFLFCLEYMRAFCMLSTDEGRSFTRPVEITTAFADFRREYDWKILATGPGHGIQLRSGRLVVPVWLSTGTGGGAHRPSITSVIYSDDHGATWHRGEIAAPNTGEWINPNETAAAELADGRVMLNIRTESKAHRRLIVYSRDGATGWSRPEFHPQLLEPICFGSLVRSGKGLLFVNPDNLSRADGKGEPGASRDRKNLTVQLSTDDGRTWPRKAVIEPGAAAYADLAVARDGTIVCLYEKGRPFESLVLARFNREWISQPRTSP